MQWHGKTQGIFGFAVLFVERGLDLAGITNDQAAIFLWIIAGGLVFWAIYLNKEELSRIHLQFSFQQPFFLYDYDKEKKAAEDAETEYMPLREASVKTYSALRKKNVQLVKDVDQYENTEEDKLSYVANAISLCVNIYGIYPPSEELELIPHKSSSIWEYINGGDILQESELTEDFVRYKDCAIKTEDLDRVIEELGGKE